MKKEANNTDTNEKICDLHTHSTYSDGTMTPRDLLRHAHTLGIPAIALTDHNTVEGLDELLSCAPEYGVSAVAGTELSTDWNGTELHILALFLPRSSFEAVRVFTRKRNESKEQSNISLAKQLRAAGYDIDYEKIKEKTDAPVPNRAHFATELMEQGYFDDLWDAFHKLLNRDSPFYQPTDNPDSIDVIREILAWGGIPVLAHPLLELSPEQLATFLSEAVPAGLCAMEAYYTRFSAEQTALLRDLCRRFSILESGGSDFHGTRKPDTRLGSGTGNLMVPFSVYDRLLEKSKEIQGVSCL